MVTGCRGSALHPLGSLDDHAYVIEDAEIETLVFDPSFGERAAQLQERCPKLNTAALVRAVRGRRRSPRARDEVRGRSDSSRRTCNPRDVAGFAYTGARTRQAKGRDGTYRSGATMTMIQMAEWEWPEDTRFLICTPLSHAGAAFFIPTLLTGGAIVVLPHFEPGLVLETIEKYKITATMIVPTMLYVLLDSPKLDQTDVSSPADRLPTAPPRARRRDCRRRSVVSARSSSSTTARPSAPWPSRR